MRKSLGMAVLVIVLCVGLGVTGFVRLNESGKQIQYEETVLFGNKSAVDGLMVRHQLYAPIAENGRYRCQKYYLHGYLQGRRHARHQPCPL